MSTQKDDGYMQMYRRMNKSFDQKINQRECEIVSDWRSLVVAEAAVVAAKEAGLDGAASEQFINGFEGADIKACNPRKLGLLAEFKAGVAARKEREQAIDAATRRAYLASLNQSKSRSFDVDSSGLPSNLR